MYHAIVKQIARKNFLRINRLLRINRKDYDVILADCSATIHHRFAGEQALGDERHDRGALRLWFSRLGRLSPSLTLTVLDVWVKRLAERHNRNHSMVSFGYSFGRFAL